MRSCFFFAINLNLRRVRARARAQSRHTYARACVRAFASLCARSRQVSTPVLHTHTHKRVEEAEQARPESIIKGSGRQTNMFPPIHKRAHTGFRS